jgi:hypothetical protein
MAYELQGELLQRSLPAASVLTDNQSADHFDPPSTVKQDMQ